jgi:uncharacterized protein
MQLSHERPDYPYSLRTANGRSATVNDQVLQRSFILTPSVLQTEWPAAAAQTLQPADLQPLLALDPEVVLLGTGARQVFPPAEVMAACLTRGVGIEVMTNDAAARTFHILAGEGRRVVAGFILEA